MKGLGSFCAFRDMRQQFVTKCTGAPCKFVMLFLVVERESVCVYLRMGCKDEALITVKKVRRQFYMGMCASRLSSNFYFSFTENKVSW